MKKIHGIIIWMMIQWMIMVAMMQHTSPCFSEETINTRNIKKKRNIEGCENPVYIIRYNWIGARILAEMMDIMITEKLGYCTEIIDMEVADSLDNLSSKDKSYLTPEFWYQARKTTLDGYINAKTIINAGELGIVGRVGWYVKQEYLTEVQGVDDYRSFRNEDTAKLFSTNSTYPDGRFIGAPTTWKTYDDDIIKNLALRLKIERVNNTNGENELIKHFTEAKFDKDNIKNLVLSYFWEPHELFVKLNLQRVALPLWSELCFNDYHVKENMIDCDYPQDPLIKIHSAPLETQYPKVTTLLKNTKMDAENQVKMMAEVSYNNMTEREAACNWLKENEATMTSWLPTFNLADNIWLIVIIVFGGALLLVCFFVIILLCAVILFIAWVRMTQAGKLKFAPRMGPMAILFMEIHNLDKLWEMAPNHMKNVLAIHDQMIRQLIPQFEGYEVKTQSDSFMIVFAQPSMAIQFAARAQECSLQANWPIHIMHLPDCKIITNAKGELLLRGPRLRIGISYGYPNCVMDRFTQLMDYFGPDVNKAARIETLTTAGEILIDQAMAEAVSDIIDVDPRMHLDALGEYQLTAKEDMERIHRLHWHPYDAADKVNKVSIQPSKHSVMDTFKTMDNSERINTQHQMFEVMTNEDLAKTFTLLKMHMHDAQVDFENDEDDDPPSLDMY